MEKAPARLRAGERVPGLFVSGPPASRRAMMKKYKQNTFVSLFPSAEEAKAFAHDDNNELSESEALCVTPGDRASGFSGLVSDGRELKEPMEWPSFFEARPSIIGRAVKGSNEYGGVIAAHVERLTRDAGDPTKATLEMTDTWVDPLTGGLRLIRNGTLPLVRVATGPAGIEVLAARDGEEVQLVVTGAKLPGMDAGALSFARQFTRMNAVVNGFQLASSDCGRIRMALRPSDERGPTLAVVQTTALLPALDKGADDDGHDETETNPRARSFRMIQAMRKRAVNVALSVTKTSADKEPLVSVGIGWAGREQRQ
jgi:hypothetical protein